MIGVIAADSLKPVVKEFFELFKTPWEFYAVGVSYDVLLVSDDVEFAQQAKLIIIYGDEKRRSDDECGLKINGQYDTPEIVYRAQAFPLYGTAVSFEDTAPPFLRIKNTDHSVAIRLESSDQRRVRVGYDLFREIKHLLTVGQPETFAFVPSLELHIAFLRDLILDSGLPFVEIPPRPAGHSFMACMTHDVDFAGMRFHKFDRTMLGFVYRAFFVSAVKALKGDLPGRKWLKNIQAVLSIPLVYAGVKKDFLVNFDRYLRLEEGIASTFYLIPFKNSPGRLENGPAPSIRAAKYDVADILPELKRLLAARYELGLHGIDAWRDSEKGRQERDRIADISGDDEVGVRMHWLYFSSDSPLRLEQSGFSYDSSVGYNERIGYRAGTTQVFKHLGVDILLELPLHIMDTALFYPSRMGLTEKKALPLVKKIILDTHEHGGVLTINWHQRSIGPERFWDDFYLWMRKEAKALNGYFCTARQAVKWFRKRRSAIFHRACATESGMAVQLSSPNEEVAPSLVLRTYHPAPTAMKRDQDRAARYTDTPFNGCLEAVIPFHG
jgi:hypothetical protein